MADFCKSCNAKLGGMFGKVSSYDDPEMCVDCFGEMQAKLGEARNKVEKKSQEEKAAELEARVMEMRISTAFAIAGRDVEQELDVITAECAFGMNLFRDLFAGVRDLVGGRSVATQKVLRDARKTCLTELKKEAAAIGADAIIGVDLDYQEFSGGGKSMLFLVASGTAVTLKEATQ